MEFISKKRDWAKPAYSLSEDRTFNNSHEFDSYCEENDLYIGGPRPLHRRASDTRVFKYDKQLKRVVEISREGEPMLPYDSSKETEEDRKWIERCAIGVKSKHPEYSDEKCHRIAKVALLRERSLAQEEKK